MRDDDDDLLARTAHQPEAFGTFYRRYERPVLAYFMRRTHDADLAADLCAETFAAALLASRRYQPRGEPATAWLFAIARHELLRSLDRRRAEVKARRALQMAHVTRLDDETREAIERIADDDQVLTLIDHLPTDQALAVRQRVLHDETYHEIAARTGSSPIAVRKRISRGLAALRAALKENA